MFPQTTERGILKSQFHSLFTWMAIYWSRHKGQLSSQHEGGVRGVLTPL